jgi:superfamily II DNA/RNA helicase
VLAPTRELAAQITAVLCPLARIRRHEVVSVYGGVGYGPQRRALAAGAEVVVACPGRLEDLLSMGALRLDDVRQVVVDEADRMSDMGFLPAVRRLLEQTRAHGQVLLFSATLDGAVGKLAAAVQHQPVRHDVGPDGPGPAARHAFWAVERADQSEWVAEVARGLGSTLVFCRTRHRADGVVKRLTKLGVSAAPIHGGRSQAQRDRALKAFAGRGVTALVATDVAARGIHVDDVAAVVHYDPPADPATYLHRSGRTARAGASGVVLTFVEPGTERSARALQRTIGVNVTVSQPDITSLRPSLRDIATDTPTAAARRLIGTLAFFHDRRGYGFIAGADRPDIFVHHTNLTGRVVTGQRVQFRLRDGRKGPEAFDVVAIDTGPETG